MPEPLPVQPPAVGQRPDSRLSDAILEAAGRDTARQLAKHLDDPAVPTYADGPQIGTVPPVAQPGRPPMSQRAVDVSSVMLAGSVASVPVGGMTCLVLYMLDQVDPVSLAIGATAPVALVLAVSRLLSRAKQAQPAEVHQHYSGPVTQEHTTVNQKWGGRNTTHN